MQPVCIQEGVVKNSLGRRVKRRILDVAQRAGYDVEKEPGSFVPYRLLKRLNLGTDAFVDARTILGDTVTCVFDIGAHLGQTAERFNAAFPSATVYSFEPDPNSFARLATVAREVNAIRAIHAAVGDRDGEATFFINRFDETSSLLQAAPDAAQYLLDPNGFAPQSEITVPLLSLDRFCGVQGIGRIDVLKIDAQGNEVRILEGAHGLLERRAIPLIYVEVCFVRIYQGQPLFPEVYEYLYQRGFRLVWLYGTSFHTHYYALGADALFIHESIGRRNTRPLRRDGQSSPVTG
jgi:FkbM family methyltransferase